jgi:hypothetical protein
MYQGPKAEGNLRRTFTRSTVHEPCHIWTSSTQGRGVYRQEGKCSVKEVLGHKDENPTQKVSFDVIGLEMYSLFTLHITNGHKKTRGGTGAGITSADEINMDEADDFISRVCTANLDIKPTMLTNCFIQETCPWFFEMRDVIGERPNVVPSGERQFRNGYVNLHRRSRSCE